MKDERLQRLFEEARGDLPFGAPRDYGFATSLRAAIGRERAERGTLDFFGELSWRIALVFLPVVLPAVAAIGFLSSRQLPGGMSDAVAICSGLLRLDGLPLF